MAITRGTLQIARRLRRDIGTEVDQVVRDLTGAWIKAWDELAPGWQLAAADLVAEAGRLDHWPRPTDIARLDRVMGVLDASEQALSALAERTRTDATGGAERVIDADVELEARIIASQAPTTEQEGLLRHLTGRLPVAEQDRNTVALQVTSRIRTDAVDVMRNRAAGQITADTLPLAPAATASMQRELIRGIDVGANPREAAARMVAGVEGRFNGGLDRAMNISRTEMLDAYRTTSHQIHAANADIVPAWEWLSALGLTTCPSCWAMHGQQFPVSTPGPDDHPAGKCTRLPVLASWAELGISGPEPPSLVVDAEARFWALPRAQQLRIMGPGRLRLLEDGAIGWGDLSKVRQNPGWRPSRVPTPLRDLQQRVDRGLPPTLRPRPAAPARQAPPARLGTTTVPAPAPRRTLGTTTLPIPQRRPTFDERVATAVQGDDVLASAPVGRGKNLSPSESAALEHYALNGFNPINSSLRAEHGAPEWLRRTYPTVSELDAALARSVLPNDVLVFRGVSDGPDIFGDAWAGSLAGAEWVEYGYVSTSANPYVSGGFAAHTPRGAFMNIIVPKGTRALSVPGYEDELLLRRGTRMRVVYDSGPDGGVPRRIDVEVIL